MLYIIGIIVLITIIVFTIKNSSKEFGWKSLSVFLAVLCVLFMFLNLVDLLNWNVKDSRYVKTECVYNDPQSYELEVIPGTNNEYTRFIEFEHEDGYTYCIKNKNGDYILTNTSNGYFEEVKFVYTDDVHPYLIIESGQKVTTLTEKPSIWFHLCKWYKVKNWAVGDIVQEQQLVDTYTFYVPSRDT